MTKPETKVDDDIRDACAALERAVPDDYFESLGGRIEARLDAELEGEAMGLNVTPTMTNDSGNKSDTPPPAGRSGSSREENTGLHDIKAMATSTKKRISRRMSTESDHEESLLASASSSSLAAVVLPEPGKDEEHYADEGAAAPRAVAASTAGVAAADAERGSGLPLWIYGVAGAAVAAAAIIFFVVRSGDKEQTTVARSEAAAGAADTSAANQPTSPAPEPTASSIPQASGAAAAGDETSDSVAPAEDPSSATASDQRSAAADKDVEAKPAEAPPAAPTAPAKQDRSERSRSHSRRSTGRTSASSSSSSKASASPASHHAAKSKPKSGDGKRSLDDLLDEAAGGAVANKDVAPADKPAEKKAPSKTELSRGDITGGMRKVSGRVSACYDKFQEAGTVMVKVAIDPDGHVSSASATGKFKNTDTGLCVAQAVEKAKFPAWDGTTQHINYPFLLSP